MKYYSTLKKNKGLINAAMWMNLRNIFSKRRLHIVKSPFINGLEITRVGKFIDRNQISGGQGLREGKWEETA